MTVAGYPMPLPFEGRPAQSAEALIPLPEKVPLPDGIYTSDDPTHGEAIRLASQELHTKKYLKVGYITPEDLDESGMYIDYADRSTYYYTQLGERGATARQITCDKKRGISSLPTFYNFAIDPEALKQAAGVENLTEIKPKKVVEISGLASNGPNGISTDDPNTVHLIFSRMLRDSIEKGHEYWTLNTYGALAKRIQLLIGEDQMHQIGEKRMYLGSVTKPYLIKPQEVVKSLLGSEDPRFDYHKAYLREVFDGVNIDKVPKEMQQLFAENDITTESSSWIKRLVKNKNFLINAALVAYCTARAIPVATVEEFEGSTEAFWAIDVATTYPYAWGLLEMHRGKTPGRRALGAIAATGSFAAPYLYMYTEGNNYPTYVHGAVGGFAAYALTKEIVSRHRLRHNEITITDALRAAPEE